MTGRGRGGGGETKGPWEAYDSVTALACSALGHFSAARFHRPHRWPRCFGTAAFHLKAEVGNHSSKASHGGLRWKKRDLSIPEPVYLWALRFFPFPNSQFLGVELLDVCTSDSEEKKQNEKPKLPSRVAVTISRSTNYLYRENTRVPKNGYCLDDCASNPKPSVSMVISIAFP